jgi:alkanesulfonate monooxygenase SsuD/methylene tetrahydromethanopterin reductase-like flavin-dependent oxidoreductase (luciferase family)
MKINLMSLGDHIEDPITGELPTPAQRHRMLIEAAVVAEAAGFHGVNIGEHHGIDYIYSAPPVVLAAIGERTRTLRLGTAVTLLANLDALRAAEDYATLDVLSGGRVDVVAGRGNFFASTYTLFGQDVEESRQRFDEGVELFDLLWTSGPLKWTGEFRASINGEALQPQPLQPRTPMWIGGGSSPETAELAARLGFKLMLPSAFGNPSVFQPVAAAYREHFRQAGHAGEPEIGGCWHVNVAKNSQDAKARWEPRYRRYHEWMRELLLEVNPAMPKHMMKPFDYEWLLENGPAIAGSPAEVVERLGTLSEMLNGATTHLLYLEMGGMPQSELLEMVELIGSDVIPRLV